MPYCTVHYLKKSCFKIYCLHMLMMSWWFYRNVLLCHVRNCYVAFMKSLFCTEVIVYEWTNSESMLIIRSFGKTRYGMKNCPGKLTFASYCLLSKFLITSADYTDPILSFYQKLPRNKEIAPSRLHLCVITIEIHNSMDHCLNILGGICWI